MTRPSVGGDDRGLILLGDHGAGVEDVRQQVVEVGAVGAGEVGADLAADAEEGVALLAGLGEDGPAERQVGPAGVGLRQRRLVAGRSSLALSGGVSRTMPQTSAICSSRSASLRLRSCRTRSADRSAAGTFLAPTASSSARA